jgi:hypothetical protein
VKLITHLNLELKVEQKVELYLRSFLDRFHGLSFILWPLNYQRKNLWNPLERRFVG